MMNRKDFYEYIKNNVLDYLPSAFEKADVELREVVKNNDQYLMALDIQKEGESICPTIYLNQLYDQYRQGKDLDTCVGDVADLRIEYDVPGEIPDIHNLSDYEWAKSKLQIRICDPELNEERLKNLVYTIHGDYAATYHVNLSDPEGNSASIGVTQDVLERWGVTKEQLHEDALAAEKLRETLLCNMADLMDEIMLGKEPVNMLTAAEYDVPGILEMPMFCLTNDERKHGAALILQDDLLEKIGSIIRSDYYILPSSQHEVILLPANHTMQLSEMTSMVREINETQVEPEDRLSDKIQYYSREDHVLENAEKREKRQKMEKKEPSKKGIKSRMAEAKKEAALSASSNNHRHKSKEAVL